MTAKKPGHGRGAGQAAASPSGGRNRSDERAALTIPATAIGGAHPSAHMGSKDYEIAEYKARILPLATMAGILAI